MSEAAPRSRGMELPKSMASCLGAQAAASRLCPHPGSPRTRCVAVGRSLSFPVPTSPVYMEAFTLPTWLGCCENE